MKITNKINLASLLRRHYPLSCILVLFIILGLVHAIVTPIFEKPDEVHHFAAVDYIARMGRLPVGTGQDGPLYGQEGYQAPLYYVLSAWTILGIDTSDLDLHHTPQPKANFADPSYTGKKNVFIHLPVQAFPYRRTTLAVRVVRGFSVLLGAGTVVLVYIAARIFFARSVRTEEQLLWLASLCAGFTAFIPQFPFICSSVSNDPMITFTAALSFTVLLWMVQNGGTRRRAALLGLALGLMCLSKLVGTFLAIFALAAMFVTVRPRHLVLIALAVALLVSGWWYVRNQMLYGDPLAFGALARFFGVDPVIRQLPSWGFMWGEFRSLRFTTWGLFGQMNIFMEPIAIYLVLDILTLIGSIGLIVGLSLSLVQSIRREKWRGILTFLQEHQLLIIALLWFGLVFAAVVRWIMTVGAQGRLLFPALPAAVFIMVYGLRSLFGCLSPRTLALGLTVPMLALSIYVIPANIIPAYAPPPIVNHVPANVITANATFNDEIALRGYAIRRDRNMLYFTFYWETLKTPPVDYTVAVRFVRADGSFWLDYVNYPGMGSTLPTLWKPGEIRRDDYVFDFRRLPSVDQPFRWIVGYYDPRTRDMTPVSNWHDVREAGWVTLLGEIDLNQAEQWQIP